MPSQIDPTRFADGQPVSKAELRAALGSAKAELEHGGFYRPPQRVRSSARSATSSASG